MTSNVPCLYEYEKKVNMLKPILNLIPNIRTSISCLESQIALQKCRIENGTLIDVREPEEYIQGFAHGAINIPRGVIEMKVSALYSDPKQPIYIYCATGIRATLAVEQLVRIGYENVHAITCTLENILKSNTHQT